MGGDQAVRTPNCFFCGFALTVCHKPQFGLFGVYLDVFVFYATCTFVAHTKQDNGVVSGDVTDRSRQTGLILQFTEVSIALQQGGHF